MTAKAIREAVNCYDEKVDFYEARKRIHNTAPGTFGIQLIGLDEIPEENNESMVIGEPGFDAPENVAFTIAGLLYGEGDFGKSICLAERIRTVPVQLWGLFWEFSMGKAGFRISGKHLWMIR